MKKISITLLLCLLCLTGMAQGQKALDLKDITSGRFRPENIQGVIPMPDGGSLFEYKTAQNGWLGSYPDNPNNAYSYHIFSATLVDEYDGPFFPIMPNNADGRYLGYSVRCVKE